MAKVRTAVLLSGRGSNFGALIAAAKAADYPAELVLALSNRPDAGGLQLARDAGIAALTVDHRRHATRADFEARMQEALEHAGVELICLAGFMRLLSADFVEAWRDRMINIHPSLLPLFPGLHTHRRALEAGVRLHGATVHFVRAEMDSGPIIAQGAVPVMPGDDEDDLAARVLQVEHRIYPLALSLVASGAARVVGERVDLAPGPAAADAALLSPSP